MAKASVNVKVEARRTADAQGKPTKWAIYFNNVRFSENGVTQKFATKQGAISYGYKYARANAHLFMFYVAPTPPAAEPETQA